MANEVVVNVYGGIKLTPEQELMMMIEAHQNTFLYMKALIEAEKLNPDKDEDYDGEYRIEWIKKIAISNTDVKSRMELIKLFEND